MPQFAAQFVARFFAPFVAPFVQRQIDAQAAPYPRPCHTPPLPWSDGDRRGHRVLRPVWQSASRGACGDARASGSASRSARSLVGRRAQRMVGPGRAAQGRNRRGRGAETARAVALSASSTSSRRSSTSAGLRSRGGPQPACRNLRRAVGRSARQEQRALLDAWRTPGSARRGQQRRATWPRRHEAIEELLHPLSETLARYERGLQSMELERKGAYASAQRARRRASRGARAAAEGDPEPGDGPAVAPDTWPLGRNDAAQHGPGGGHGRALRFRGAAVDADRGRHRSGPTWSCTCPAGDEVVIDAKVPLDAFLQFIDAEDEAARKALLDKHARQLRTHVDQLAKKEYWKHVERSPEFVVAFVPGESLLAAACEADPGLQDHALSKRIVLATPNTLVAALRTIGLSLAAGAAGRKRAAGPAARRRALRAVAHDDGPHAGPAAQPHLERRRLQQGHWLARVRGSSSRPGSSPASAWSGPSHHRSPSSRRSRRRRATCRRSSCFDDRRERRVRADDRDAARRRRQHRPPRPDAHHGGAGTPATYSAGVLHAHRSDRADTLVAKLAELVAVPLDRPDGARGRLGADPRDRTLAHPTALGSPRARVPARTTGCAPTSVSHFPGR